MKTRRINDLNENEMQTLYVSFCLQNNLIPVAIPNGFNLSGAYSILRKNGISTKELGALNAKQIRLLKKEGLHTGFPDLMVFGRCKKGDEVQILFVENKIKGNTTSKEQKACHKWLSDCGFNVIVPHGLDEAIAFTTTFFELTETKDFQVENIMYILDRKSVTTD